ncbi:hypothetical protein DV113_004256 [Geotrichum candidum]|uniref:DUF1746 domain-containing protein n=1 Tax=Geotrichum candidum TaxID=1173061 RepID=A0A0J9XKV0_GEOCN|nr:hypothetical protein DV113_004256 [Geotrichum candidum]KAI8134622.1 hypothetical protein DUD61_001771 [Geotrichum candidum]CDO58034.1 conserved hypothetical protein [Geotrichum candidum]
MSEDSSSSASASISRSLEGPSNSGGINGGSSSNSGNTSSTNNNNSDTARSDRSLGTAKRAQFQQHFLRALDLLACHYLVLIYLHDTSTYRLVLRGLVQTIFLSPRIARIRLPAVFNSRPILVILLAVNAYCVVAHALLSRGGGITSSSSSSRVLHGGLTTEFIGDRMFSGVTPFIVLDVAVFVVQLGLFCIMFFPALTRPTLISNSHLSQSSCADDASGQDEENSAAAAEEDNDVVPDIYDFYTGTYTLADLRLMDTLSWAWTAHLHAGLDSAADVEAGLGRGPATPSDSSGSPSPSPSAAAEPGRNLTPTETISRFIQSLA